MKVGSMKISMVKAITIMVSGLAGAAVNAFLLGLLVMLLWNWIVPSIFPKLPASQHITYWQGWGMVYLIHLLGFMGRK